MMTIRRAVTIACKGALVAVCLFGTTMADEATLETTAEPNDPFKTTAPTAAPTPSAKLSRYAKRIIDKYDTNGDGMLQPAEWKMMAGKPESIDADQDGVITANEYAAHVAAYGHFRRMLLLSPNASENRAVGGTTGDAYEEQPLQDDRESLRRSKKFYVPSSRLPKGLSQEFFNRDRDGDGQLTQSEFSPKLTAADAERFKKLDANLDGVITAREYARGPKSTPSPSDNNPAAPEPQP
ncbi:hypothetical protein [Symmachiella dynata]|uniref:hypothetical protein n=1 Tax=Symmachiella dynata TaxID=2527995 RepID=UPI0018D39EEE|nr:hypothetical protein [Symmachiella dynata]